MTTRRDRKEPTLSAADEQLLRELTERARAGGLKLTGEGGLLGKLTKMVVEGALEGELDDHLGYAKHDPAGRDGGNSRNGHRAKTVLTDTGPVEISVPRDRDSGIATAPVDVRGDIQLPGTPDLLRIHRPSSVLHDSYGSPALAVQRTIALRVGPGSS